MITKKITNKPLPSKEDLKYSFNGEKFKDIDSLVLDIHREYKNEDFDFDDNNGFEITLNDLKIEFCINRLPYCCGILELGSLNHKRITPNAELVAIKEVSSFLDKFVEYKGLTFMINTNGKAPCILFEKALAKCKNWVLVKEFVNSNSNNTIKMWISNNE
jgi:hypothetical protein